MNTNGGPGVTQRAQEGFAEAVKPPTAVKPWRLHNPSKLMGLDLKKIKKIYFIGIKGVAMSGLAIICKERGMEVAGSDVKEKFITDKVLAQNKIKVFSGFRAKNLDFNPDLVVLGVSWPETNPEVKEVKKRKLPLIMESELRGWFFQEKKGIAVAGVHGKTTTTALLAYIFTKAGLEPGYFVGTGLVPSLGTNAQYGQGRHFIGEADEYKRSFKENVPKFLDLEPEILVLTSLEHEHPDFYKNLSQIEKAFRKFIKKVPRAGLVVACADWPSIKKITRGFKNVVSYGLGKAFWQAYDLKFLPESTYFKVKRGGKFFADFEMKLAGAHNVSNALAALIVSLHEDIKLEKIKKALKNFSGTERRFEISVHEGITFIDDYAHHPSEIRATLEAARQRFARQKIWCIFQPHLVSRTQVFLKDFAQSFTKADKVVLVDIFRSAREKIEGVGSYDLAQEAKKYHQGVTYTGSIQETIKFLKNQIKAGQVILTMGAGDVYKVRNQLIKTQKSKFKNRSD